MWSQKLHFALLLLLSVAFTACQNDSSSKDSTAPGNPIITKVTRETYMSGEQFCERYKEITGQEYGKYISVPKDYSDPSKGNLKIYVYTLSTFDPKKPSYIYVDGGPGQNTHGLMPNYTKGRMNELRFDQRGLGCSAPATYDEYSQASIYSTANTVKDMEEIRKAYGIEKWTVYGVSYGTVPATVYGSKYNDQTNSVVLEGVVGNLNTLDSTKFKADKLNILRSRLNEAQKSSFSDLMAENSEEAQAFIGLMVSSFYQDRGIKQISDLMPRIIDYDGTINRTALKKIKDLMTNRDRKYTLPQQPGAVDENIQITIYCRDLGVRTNGHTQLSYSRYTGFYAKDVSGMDFEQLCLEQGVHKSSEDLYTVKDTPISKPVYYFQGSHDGATQARGAFTHWKQVPQNKSYFLLAQKGGHNPNLTRLESGDAKSQEQALFVKALMAEEITKGDVESANILMPAEQKWILFLAYPTDPNDLEKELEGIKRVVNFN